MTSCATGVCGTGGWTGPLPGDPNLNDSILSAIAVFGGIAVTWTFPSVNPAAVAHTRVYRGVSMDPNSAVEIAVVAGNSYYDRVDSSEQLFYWIRNVSVNGTEGELLGPAYVTAQPLVEALVDQLLGQIDIEALTEPLKSSIDRITVLQSDLQDEIKSREDGNTSLAESIQAAADGVAQALTFIDTETQTRNEQNSLLADQLTAVAATSADNLAAVQEQLQSSIDTVDGRVTTNASRIDQVAAQDAQNLSAVQSTLTASITAVDGRVTQNASKIDQVSSTIPGATGNLVENSEFTWNTSGWTPSFGLSNGQLLRNLAGWYVGDGTAYVMESNGYDATRMNSASGSFDVTAPDLPVVPGQNYQFSAYTGAHRCLVTMYVLWLDANKVAIKVGGDRGVGAANINDAEAAGGTVLSGYKRIGFFDAAPAGAAFLRPVMRKLPTENTGGTNSYMFFTRVFVGTAHTGQTVLDPYAPGPTGATVRTEMSTKIDANTARLGTIEANYTLKVQARSDGKFAVAGIGLNATANTAYAQSSMVFMADMFTFVPSSAGINAVPQPLLVAGVVNGANTVVFPGQLIGDKLVESRMVVDGAIQARHMTITGGAGGALNLDPGTSDYTVWTFNGQPVYDPSCIVVVNGPAGKTALRIPGPSGAPHMGREFPVTGGKQYRVTFTVRRSSPGTGADYVRLYMLDAVGNTLADVLADVDTGASFEGRTFSAAWTTYRATITAPAAAVTARLGAHMGYAGTAVGDIQGWKVEEMIDYSLVVQGGLKADRIDTRGLTIKDAAGNVIFGSGTNLDSSLITPSQNWLNDKILQNKNWVQSLQRWITSSAAIGGGIYMSPDGYYGVIAGSTFGILQSPVMQIPPGSWTVSFIAYCGAARQLRCDLFPDDLPEVFVTLTPTPTLYKLTLSVPDIPSRLACYLRFFPGDTLPGDMIITAPQLELGGYTPWKPANEDVVSVSNQLTPANASTYIQAAAIGDALIGNYIKSAGFDGAFDANGNMGYVGTTGWGISKNGKAVFNNVIVRQVLDVISGVPVLSVGSTGMQGTFSNTGQQDANLNWYASPDGGWTFALRFWGPNNHSYPINQRVRYANSAQYPVAFFVAVNAITDDGLSLWVRVSGGAWYRLVSTITAGAGDSFGSICYTLLSSNTSVFPNGIGAGDYVDFAVTATHFDQSYATNLNLGTPTYPSLADRFADGAKRYLNYVSFTVNCVNI